MSCTPPKLALLASNYLIEHEQQLRTPNGAPFTHEEFEDLRKDLTLELEGAISDRGIEWRDKQNGR